MPFEPSPHRGVFVSCVIVEDEVNDFSGRNLGIDGVEEADELLMPWR